MIRTFFGIMAVALLASGCCGPMGCGPSCGGGYCSDCDGVGPGMAWGPMDQLRSCRKRLVCGSGCGETYRGEWISTPPDCSDPCCGSQYVGGAVVARPFCWQPGALLSGLCGNLYGGRYCSSCGESYGDCGCGCGGEFIEEGYMETVPAGDCGCASCARQNGAATRMAQTRGTATAQPTMAQPRRMSPR